MPDSLRSGFLLWWCLLKYFKQSFPSERPIDAAVSGRIYLESVIIRDETLVFLLFWLFINDADIYILYNGVGSSHRNWKIKTQRMIFNSGL